MADSAPKPIPFLRDVLLLAVGAIFMWGATKLGEYRADLEAIVTFGRTMATPTGQPDSGYFEVKVANHGENRELGSLIEAGDKAIPQQPHCGQNDYVHI